MTRTILYMLALVTFCPSITGCWFTKDVLSEPSSVVTLNERGDEIWVEEFWYAGFNWGGGVHTKWESAGSPVYPPYPDTAKFRWHDDEGNWHEQEVKIDPPIPNSFRGRIYFRFQPDNSIKVSPVTWKDYRAGRRAGSLAE